MKFIEGRYATPQSAFLAVERLQAQGYEKKDIRLISNEATRHEYHQLASIEITTEHELTEEAKEHRSLWEKIKDAFSDETYNEEEIQSDQHLLYDYREDLQKGYIVILVEGEPKDRLPDEEVPSGYPNESIETLREKEIETELGYNRHDPIL